MIPKLAATRPESGKRFPEGEAEIARQQPESVGADRIKRDIAEVEQPGEPDDDIETPAEHHIDQHGGAEIDQIARRERQERQGDGKADPDDRDRQHLAIPPGGEAVSTLALPLARARRLVKQPQHEPAGKYRRAGNGDPIEMGADAERAAADVIGLQALPAAEREARRPMLRDGVLEERQPKRPAARRVVDGEPGGSRHQTFSTSGRPSRPVGQKTRTRTSTTKTETSLYSTEK